MYDSIKGKVIEIIDGDTFKMNVTQQDESNKYKYNPQEIIRIADTNAPELDSLPGQLAKISLEKRLLNKNVRCKVKSRDRYGRLICDVNVVYRRSLRRKTK